MPKVSEEKTEEIKETKKKQTSSKPKSTTTTKKTTPKKTDKKEETPTTKRATKSVANTKKETATTKFKTKTQAKPRTIKKEENKKEKTKNKKIKEEKVEKVEIEEIEKVEENKDLIIKKDPKQIIIDEQKLDKIEEEIKKQKSIPKEKRNKMNKKIFNNIIIGVGIVLYFIFINLDFFTLEPSTYLTDLKVFSVIILGIAITIFEKAYKKDSGELAIYGIEMLVLSICSLMTNYFYLIYNNKYPYIINMISLIFAVYYVAKSIVIYVKMKKSVFYKTSDIHKIIKK